jgi:Skp family chaperone for outer membrane proteins
VDEATGTGSSEVNEQEQRSPEEIRRDIEDTREDLGDTAEALAQKADVKGQAKAKFEGMKQSAQAKTQEFTAKAKEAAPDSAGSGAQQVTTMAQENPVPVALAGAFVAGALVSWILSR